MTKQTFHGPRADSSPAARNKSFERHSDMATRSALERLQLELAETRQALVEAERQRQQERQRANEAEQERQYERQRAAVPAAVVAPLRQAPGAFLLIPAGAVPRPNV